MFREMISSEAIVRDSKKTLDMARFDPVERPLIQQIFGADPQIMGRSAAMIMERFNPDGIDINMGCPVYKLTCNFNGAALMKEPERAMSIVRSVRSAIGFTPLSVKIRLGWSSPTEARVFAQKIEEAGADLITVHARTKAQGYSGIADWNEIAEIKKRVSIPVLVNGDIIDATTALRALQESKADGIMIARGALGNPWVFQEIANALDRQQRHPGPDQDPIGFWSSQNDDSVEPSITEKISVILKHAELMLERYGPHGIIQFRKHIAWYFKRIPGTKTLRQQLLQIKTIDELQTQLRALSEGSPIE